MTEDHDPPQGADQYLSAKRVALLRFRTTLFKADMASSEVNERFSQLLLAFTAGALTLLAGHFREIADTGWAVSVSWSAVILVSSLIFGTIQLTLAHVAALVRSGFMIQAEAEKAGQDMAEGLPIEEMFEVIRQVLMEVRATRFPPDRWLFNVCFREANLLDGIAAVQHRLQRIVQFQALCFRLQLLAATGSAIPPLLVLVQSL